MSGERLDDSNQNFDNQFQGLVLENPPGNIRIWEFTDVAALVNHIDSDTQIDRDDFIAFIKDYPSAAYLFAAAVWVHDDGSRYLNLSPVKSLFLAKDHSQRAGVNFDRYLKQLLNTFPDLEDSSIKHERSVYYQEEVIYRLLTIITETESYEFLDFDKLQINPAAHFFPYAEKAARIDRKRGLIPVEDLRLTEDLDELSQLVAGLRRFDLPLIETNPVLSGEDTLGLYLNQIGKMEPPETDEELDLGKRILNGRIAQMELQTGNVPEERARLLEALVGDARKCREFLVVSNLRLVISIAKKYTSTTEQFKDFIQAGNIGLIRAAENYDYRYKAKFATYATWVIRRDIMKSKSNIDRPVHMPNHISDRLILLAKISDDYRQKYGREPTLVELAQAADLKLKAVVEAINLSQETVSLDEPVGDGEKSERGDFIPGTGLATDDDAEGIIFRQTMEKIISRLPDDEQWVIKLKYGFEDGLAHTDEEIAQLTDTSIWEVRRALGRAMDKLKLPRIRHMVRDF